MIKKQPKDKQIGTFIPTDHIDHTIYMIRGQRVMLDEDLAKLYGVETRILNQAIRRNLDRFPDDFMFQLTEKEFSNLKSQIVISRWGGRRKKPLAFTEHGTVMKQLSEVRTFMLKQSNKTDRKFRKVWKVIEGYREKWGAISFNYQLV